MRRKDELSAETVEAAFTENVHLLAAIEGVSHVRLRPLLPTTRHNFTHALIADMRDEAALAAYRPHPLHLKFAEFSRTMMGDAMVLDWEE
jgi:hypothetical protein